MNEPRPKFCVGELVAVVTEGPLGSIGKTEITDAVYFPEDKWVVGFCGQPAMQRHGWKYEVGHCLDFLIDESCLRKLPPDDRIAWQAMIKGLKSPQPEREDA